MKTLKTTIGIGAVALACAIPQASFGSLTSLADPTSLAGLNISGASTTTAGWTLVAQMDNAFSASTISGDLYSAVYNTGSGLAFVYDVTRSGISDNINRLTVGGFGGLALSVGNITGGLSGAPSSAAASTIASSADRTSSSVVGFNGLLSQANNFEVVVLTTATSYGTINAGVSDGSTANVSAFSVPEPTTMVAGAMLLLPFGMSTLRVLRSKRA